MTTTNLEKHTTANPLGRYFLDNFSKVLLHEVKELHPESILDVGAGEGFNLEMFRQNDIARHLEGIEYVDEAIELGKEIHPKVHIRKGDIYKLPYKDNTFDLVVCTEVLEHMEHPGEALSELKRVSKKYLILSVPNEPFFTIQRFLRGKNMLKFGDHPEHIQHWGVGAFKAFVGFQLQTLKALTPLPWTLIVARKK